MCSDFQINHGPFSFRHDVRQTFPWCRISDDFNSSFRFAG
jgi:hypothetical protein